MNPLVKLELTYELPHGTGAAGIPERQKMYVDYNPDDAEIYVWGQNIPEDAEIAKRLPFPRSGIVTLQISGSTLIYTTHGIGGTSVTLNLPEIIWDITSERVDIPEILTKESFMVCYNVFLCGGPEVTFSLGENLTPVSTEALLEIIEVNMFYPMPQTPWNLDYNDTPRWRSQDLLELNPNAPTSNAHSVDYNRDRPCFSDSEIDVNYARGGRDGFLSE